MQATYDAKKDSLISSTHPPNADHFVTSNNGGLPVKDSKPKIPEAEYSNYHSSMAAQNSLFFVNVSYPCHREDVLLILEQYRCGTRFGTELFRNQMVVAAVQRRAARRRQIGHVGLERLERFLVERQEELFPLRVDRTLVRFEL